MCGAFSVRGRTSNRIDRFGGTAMLWGINYTHLEIDTVLHGAARGGCGCEQGHHVGPHAIAATPIVPAAASRRSFRAG